MKTFTSSKGVVLNLKPISQFKLDSLRISKEVIPAPTYTVKTVSGEMQEYPLDEEVAKSKDRMPEWEDYQIKYKANETAYAKLFLELIVWDGVDVEVPDNDSDWYKSAQHFKMKIPDNLVERKLFYVHNELLGTAEDITGLVASVFTASGIDDEVVKRLKDSFRIGVQRKKHKPVRKGKGQLESALPDIQRSGDSSLLAFETVGVLEQQ